MDDPAKRRKSASQKRKLNMKLEKKQQMQEIMHLEKQLLDLQCKIRQDYHKDFIITPPPVEPYGEDFVNRKKMKRVKCGLLKDDQERRDRRLLQNRISNARYAMRQKTDAKNRSLKLTHLTSELDRARQFIDELECPCLYDEIRQSIKEEDAPYLHVDTFADHHDFTFISPIVSSGKLAVWDDDPLLNQADEDGSVSSHWTSDSSLDEDFLTPVHLYNCSPESSIGNW